jgi:uncharacterized membrane protein YgaE (UPF0421/DUF939 family)
MKIRNNEFLSYFILNNIRGVIPIPVIIVIAIAALAVGSSFGFFVGKGFSFTIGIVLGVAILLIVPNLDRILKWYKSVKKESLK